MHIKQPIVFILPLIVTGGLIVGHVSEVNASSNGKSPVITACSAVLLDYATGKVLYEKKADDSRAPASLTKMMTALVAIESINIETRIQVSSRAASTPGASFGIATGEKPPIWKLLYGMMLRSGNDAAMAVAEGVAGSESAFVELMNKRAQTMGLKKTHFINPHGLDTKGHTSTARELATIARTGLLNPSFARIVSTVRKDMTWNGKPRPVANINKILWEVPGADGVKTGYTGAAGYCLAASATKPEVGNKGSSASSYALGDRFVTVVLGAPTSADRFHDAQTLLEWGISGAWKNSEPVSSAALSSGSDYWRYTVKNGDTLSEIAQKFGFKMSYLMSINGITNAGNIRIGQRLKIPSKPR